MDLARLQLFVQIADTGSVSAAARIAHLSQPAVSRNLQMLEEELGVALFARQGRGVALTPAGRSLLPRARALLDTAASIRRELAEVADRGYFDLRVGTVESIATYLLPRVVEPLRNAFPELALKLTTSRTAPLLAALATGELDVALVAYSGAPEAAVALTVGPYEMHYFGRRDLFPALAEVEDESELARFPIVEIEAMSGQPSLIAPETRSFAIGRSLASVKALVLGGFGVGALLDFMLTRAERRRLVHARVPHDPNCALFVAASERFIKTHGDSVAVVLRDSIASVLAA